MCNFCCVALRGRPPGGRAPTGAPDLEIPNHFLSSQSRLDRASSAVQFGGNGNPQGSHRGYADHGDESDEQAVLSKCSAFFLANEIENRLHREIPQVIEIGNRHAVKSLNPRLAAAVPKKSNRGQHIFICILYTQQQLQVSFLLRACESIAMFVPFRRSTAKRTPLLGSSR